MKQQFGWLALILSLALLIVSGPAAAGGMGGGTTGSPSTGGTVPRSPGMGGTTTGRAADDTWITTKVKSALLADRKTSGLDIQVETSDGIVQLSGFAESNAEKQRAVEVASSIQGVRDVKDDIRISQGSQGGESGE